jgi:diguanylate cyclase (GGDEF)-like protein
MSAISLDGPTALALTALIAATLGALIIFSWAQSGRRNFYLALWGGGDILGGIAAGLWFGRGVLPDFVSINLGTAAIALAYGVMLAAARGFAGKRVSPALVSAGAAVWLIACFYPPFYASLLARIILMSALLASYTAATARELWRGRAERLPSRIPAVAFLIVHAAACLARVPIALAGGLNSPRLPTGPWFSVLAFEALLHILAMAILIVSMAKERAELEQRVVASTDDLTGALRRRAFLADGEARLGAAHASGAPSSLLLFDLDHFKSINDNFGHEMGDRVLMAFADCARSLLRPGDLFGRFGGEEFAALLVGPSAETAFVLAERMRRAVEAIKMVDGRGGPKISVSVGMATALTSERRLGDMLREADRALYRAKAAGRNRVERMEAIPKLVA